MVKVKGEGYNCIKAQGLRTFLSAFLVHQTCYFVSAMYEIWCCVHEYTVYIYIYIYVLHY